MRTLYAFKNALKTCCLAALVAFAAFGPASAQTTFGPFSSAGAVSVPDDGYNGTLGSMGSSSIAVSGVTGTSVINIEVDVNINNTWVGDLTIKLASPSGDLLTLVSRPGLAETVDDGTGCCGLNADWLGSTLTFTDLGAVDAETMNVPFTGTYFPNPGITASPTQTFASLFGGAMNGNWTLYVGDAGSGDLTTLNSWSIRISTVTPSLLAFVGVAVAPDGDCTDEPLPATLNNVLNVAPGTGVCYFYYGENTGDVTLNLHDLQDDLQGTLLNGLPYALDPATSAYLAIGPVVINSNTTNNATWTGYNAGPTDVAVGNASATVFVSPANNLCADAIALTCGQSVTGTTLGASDAGNNAALDCGELAGDLGVWYTFVGTGNQMSLSTCGPVSDVNDPVFMAVYTGGCGAFSCVINNSALVPAVGCGFANGQELIFATTEGETYHVFVASWTGGTIDFDLSLDCVCDASAGTLTADASPVTLVGGSATISATEGTAPFVPAGYSVLYVLTEGAGLVIIDAAAAPSFTVTAAGDYTIHTLVYDPATLDLGIVQFGVTTGFDVNGLLIQGGGDICGALDVAGAPIVVVTCDATAGTLTADASPVTLVGGSATISATEGTAPFVPAGYSVLYVLTEGAGLVIIDAAAAPSFTVTAAGDYTIHTLVYDPATLDLGIVQFGVTTGFDVNGLLIQGGGDICGALDVAGAPVVVQDEVTCDATAGTLTADASPVTLVGGSATISATEGTAPFVPAGYSVLYVLTEGAGLVIIDAAATPSFTVTATGDYTIHTLVYDPATLDLGIVQFGVTTGFDVNGLLIQGGGDICGALDVTGAPVVVQDEAGCNANSITLDMTDSFDDGWNGATYQIYDNSDALNPVLILSGDLDNAASGDGTGIGQEILCLPNGCYLFTVGGGEYDDEIGWTLTGVDGGPLSGGAPESVAFSINTVSCDIAGCTDPEAVNYDPTATVSDGSCVFAPVNDLCSGAIAVSCGDVVSGTTIGASASDAPVGPVSISEGVWYSFVGTGGDITVSTCSASDFDTEISVSEGSCGSLTWVGGNDDFCDLASEYTFTSVAGTTYYIYVGDWSSSTTNDNSGTFDLSITCTTPPCDATAGTLTADASPVTLVGGSATISATEGTAPFVPAGYSVLYVLTEGAGLVIIDAAATPSFTVSAAGDYTIHTLVYDPTTLDVTSVVFGTTTGFDVNGLLIQGGGTICGALDVAGAPIVVDEVVGLSESLNGSLSVYPNPSNGQFIVELNGAEGVGTVNIMDMMGRTVYTAGVNFTGTFRQSIDLNVAKGTYVLQVITENGIATRKVELN